MKLADKYLKITIINVLKNVKRQYEQNEQVKKCRKRTKWNIQI